LEYALAYPQIDSVITRSQVKLKNDLEVDLKISDPDDWGSMLQHFTGSKMHNIRLRTLAKERGLSLSEDGILEKEKLHRFKTETDFQSYEKSVKNRGIKLLIGLEVDIRPEGDFALSDKLMATLDYAIVSIHSAFDNTVAKNTERIITALSHPKALILGHPTGRIINHRQSLSADWEKVFAFCVKNHKLMEVNAYPDRLDLPDDLIKTALGKGVKLIINTDSHKAEQMNHMKYGVWQARKGYAMKRDVVNSLTWQNLQTVLK